jgi:hypothetical protein
MTANNFSTPGEQSPWLEERAGDLAAYAAREYLLEYGWTTTVRGDDVLLLLEGGLTAVTIPLEWAQLALADLRAMDLSCPVILLPKGHETQGVFLLEDAPDARPDRSLPGWLWRPWPAEDIPLPTGVSRSGISWLRPPNIGTGGTVTVSLLGRVLASLLDTHAAGAPKSFRRTA